MPPPKATRRLPATTIWAAPRNDRKYFWGASLLTMTLSGSWSARSFGPKQAARNDSRKVSPSDSAKRSPGRVVVPRACRPIEKQGDGSRDRGITAVDLVPSVWRRVLDGTLDLLRPVADDALFAVRCEAIFQPCEEPTMAKTINGRTVLVTNVLRFVLAIGCFVMSNPIGADIFTPTIDYEKISYRRLLLVYKEEYAKVGLSFGRTTESVISIGGVSTNLWFGFSDGRDRRLADARHIAISTEGGADDICSPCSVEMLGVGTHDQELSAAIIAAEGKALDRVEAEVARIAKESSKDQKYVYKTRGRICDFREVDNVALTALLTRMGLTTRADLEEVLDALDASHQVTHADFLANAPQATQADFLAKLGLPADLPADERGVLRTIYFSDPEPPPAPDPEAITPPTIDYAGISHERLISIYKKAFAKVGLTLGGSPKSAVGMAGTSTLLAFDFSGAGGQHLTDAVGIDVFSEGKPNDICSSCTAALLYLRTLDPELRPLIFAARVEAEAQVKAEVARIVKKSSKKQNTIGK